MVGTSYSHRAKNPPLPQECRELLFTFFAGRGMLHGQMPKVGTVPELDAIIDGIGKPWQGRVNRPQASRALNLWRQAQQVAPGKPVGTRIEVPSNLRERLTLATESICEKPLEEYECLQTHFTVLQNNEEQLRALMRARTKEITHISCLTAVGSLRELSAAELKREKA